MNLSGTFRRVNPALRITSHVGCDAHVTVDVVGASMMVSVRALPWQVLPSGPTSAGELYWRYVDEHKVDIELKYRVATALLARGMECDESVCMRDGSWLHRNGGVVASRAQLLLTSMRIPRGVVADTSPLAPPTSLAGDLPARVHLRCHECNFQQLHRHFWFARSIVVAAAHVYNIGPVPAGGVRYDLTFKYNHELDYEAIADAFDIETFATVARTKQVHLVAVSRTGAL